MCEIRRGVLVKKDLTRDDLSSRISLNLYLFSTVITVFVLIVTLNSSILINNLFITTQLAVSIPLLLTSTLSNITAQKGVHEATWRKHASVMFTLGYAFLSNLIGILIATQVNVNLAIVFLIVNWGVALSYSYLKIHLRQSRFSERLIKDALFIGLQILFGLLPALGIY